ncbi:MAG: M1 family metallopeptidase [Polyangiaceae bacterium]
MRPSIEFAIGCAGLVGAVALTLPGARRGAAPETPRPNSELASRPQALVASYTLNASLDPATHRVNGSGNIVWTNHSRAQVSSLFFHLHLNAFKNDRTQFLRSPFSGSRDPSSGREFGYIDVKSIKARELGGADLWAGRTPHSPGDPADETDIEVPLPRAVAPGETLTLDVEFESLLPEVMERTGYSGSFHFVAQWFPKLARLEPDGSFAHFPFHAEAEFYADFGRYDVTLDVPKAFVVGASGKLLEQRVEGARKRLHYVAEPVHDFAWTAWDGFQERDFSVHGVDVRLLFPRGQARAAELAEKSVSFALPYLSNRFGTYPYSTLTVVHPPRGAAAAGGMEYPTLITTGGHWYSAELGLREVDIVTVHELGHQWFYGLLASNEAASPFLDEGLNSYAEHATQDAYLGAGSTFAGFGFQLSGDALSRMFSAARAEDEPVASAAHDFSSFRNLGALVYSRTAVLLSTVERVWGKERFSRALRVYSSQFRFRHPSPDDFLNVIGAEVAPAARQFLHAALFQRGRVDYLVRDVQSARLASPTGFFERQSGRERVRPAPGAPAGDYVGRATVYRHGTLEVPVEVLLIGSDGRRQLEHWDGSGSYRVFELRGTELARVVIDPEHKILIDDNLFNNQAANAGERLARSHERTAYWAALWFGGALP